MHLLTLREVKEITHLSRSVIYDLMERGLFPRPIRVGRRAVRWIEREVVEFIARCPRAGGGRPSK
ncbi:MAG: AlpA family phage regulatory protein [Acidobacteria bacterium]|nr:AlpA family phage regulatory protein [Acidobacteriota bacterium]